MEQLKPKKKIGRKGKETTHIKWLRFSCEEYGAWFYKIPDLPFKLQSPKPFDVFMSAMGVPVAMEAKFLDEANNFGWSDLSEHQRDNLERFELTGSRGISMVILFVEIPKEIPIMIYIPWRYFKKMTKKGQKINFSELMSQQTKILGRPTYVEKVSAKGIKRREKQWRYPAWPFLKTCLTLHAHDLSEMMKPVGPTSSSVFRDLYESFGHPRAVAHPQIG